VTDNGSQFTAKDFKELVKDFELEHIRIRTYHPESNGKLERFHRSTREELGEAELRNLSRRRGRSSAAGWSTTTRAGCTRVELPAAGGVL
jgi:transposase InsO family protein